MASDNFCTALTNPNSSGPVASAELNDAAVRACLVSAQHRRLNKQDAVEDFKQQLRCARHLRYSRGTTSWERGYGGLEQALLVQRSEDEMTERFCRLLEKESAVPNKPSEERSALQPGIQPKESAAPNRRREEQSALQPSVHGAPGTMSPVTKRTEEFCRNFVSSLEAMNATMASEQTKARRKRIRCRKKKV